MFGILANSVPNDCSDSWLGASYCVYSTCESFFDLLQNAQTHVFVFSFAKNYVFVFIAFRNKARHYVRALSGPLRGTVSDGVIR